jgi:hypothetical protein
MDILVVRLLKVFRYASTFKPFEEWREKERERGKKKKWEGTKNFPASMV